MLEFKSLDSLQLLFVRALIVLSYLIERGYLLKPKEKPVSMDQIAGELDIHDSMIASLAEVLEQKGLLMQAEWEKAIKKRVIVE
jgi:DNA-binding MarR family transcriptional regulator